MDKTAASNLQAYYEASSNILNARVVASVFCMTLTPNHVILSLCQHLRRVKQRRRCLENATRVGRIAGTEVRSHLKAPDC
jgi:hypothetical protein